jgi:hypothetical protein
VPSQKELVSIMEQCKSTGDVREAIKTVQNAERFGLATVEIYQQLFDLLRTAPFDSEYYAVVAHWFYSDESSVSIPILNNLSIWTNVLRVAFHFGDTHRKEDLRALLERFSERFDIDKLDQESWQLLIRVNRRKKKKGGGHADCFVRVGVFWEMRKDYLLVLKT